MIRMNETEKLSAAQTVQKSPSVIVLGGGAAGMMAAITSAQQGARVTVIEQNDRLGKKILATGNGRCNLSNEGINAEQGFSQYYHHEFVTPVLTRWDYDAVRSCFFRLGLLTVADERGWVYPRSKWANSVLDVLLGAIRRLPIEVVVGATITRLEYDVDKSCGYRVIAQTGQEFEADSLIIANGVSNAPSLPGLSVQKTAPILGPLSTEETLVKSLDGIRCECKIQLIRHDQEISAEAGELLFRSYGVSGIAIFNLSRFAQKGDDLLLDLFPESSLQELEDFLRARGGWDKPEGDTREPTSISSRHPSMTVQDLFIGVLHSRLALAVIKARSLKPQDPLRSTDIPRLAAQLKSLKLKVTGTPKAAQAQVTRGGLTVEGFDPHTLEAYSYPGLFAAGEALDVDGPCGGYNLHWAWASGITAGENAARSRQATVPEVQVESEDKEAPPACSKEPLFASSREAPLVAVVGAGLAGSEAAWQLAQRGVSVRLYEMRPHKQTPAHETGLCAELVCSNSLKSLDENSAAGCLKSELARLGSQVLSCARAARVPAGGALAVDRTAFAQKVTETLRQHPLISIINREVQSLAELIEEGCSHIVVATGPLTSETLAESLTYTLGAEYLSFYDAAAPIVAADSLNHEVLFAQSRYDKAGGAAVDTGADYLNAPFDKQEYERFITELLAAERVIKRDFERKELFAACQPVEEVARTGEDSLRFGALKPVGLTDPATGRRPWAAVQLRAENRTKTAYNLVGFQTNLTFSEQKRVFSLIPGLETAEFVRYGVMHRNTFIDTPHALGSHFELKAQQCQAPAPFAPSVHFAGQLTGTEGYTEAIASGLLAALNTYACIIDAEPVTLPPTTCFGALVAYATDPETNNYQPMHVNYGIMPPLTDRSRNKRQRYAAYAQRALSDLEECITSRPDLQFQTPFKWGE